MSQDMRKPPFSIFQNKGADQLCSNRATDQHFCFHYIDSTMTTIPVLFKSENFNLCGHTAGFVSDLVGYPEDRFSHGPAHIFFAGAKTYLVLFVFLLLLN